MSKIQLPDFTVEMVLTTLSEVIDWGLRQEHVPDTWKTTMGEGVTVYLLDTGCSDHKDLEGNVMCGGSFVKGEDENDNLSGHSTHCAGIIAANKNDMGMVGVAPKAKIVFVKCLGDSGGGSVRSVVKALEFCAKAKDGDTPFPPPDIVSMSLGTQAPLPTIHYWIKKLYEKDVPIVCATGNKKQQVAFPARYPETIAVGAYDPKGKIASFSNFGPEVDFAAPGVGIYSTYLNNRYAKLNGTSMATPFVSGIIALMLSKHRKQEKETGENDCQTVTQIKEHLIKYSKDAGAEGKDVNFGYGIIDVPKLIAHGEKSKEEKPKISLMDKIRGWFRRVFRVGRS